MLGKAASCLGAEPLRACAFDPGHALCFWCMEHYVPLMHATPGGNEISPFGPRPAELRRSRE